MAELVSIGLFGLADQILYNQTHCLELNEMFVKFLEKECEHIALQLACTHQSQVLSSAKRAEFTK